jgi:ABC-type transport system involved in cytochrome bd biosynthesis fused ATPase/permease subunit
MLLDIFLSVTSLPTSSIVKSPLPLLMQYLMLLTMGGVAVTLSKKQLKKVARKLKWELLKDSIKKLFKPGDRDSNGKIAKRIILILLLGGLLVWGAVALLGPLGWLFLIIVLIKLLSRPTKSHF